MRDLAPRHGKPAPVVRQGNGAVDAYHQRCTVGLRVDLAPGRAGERPRDRAPDRHPAPDPFLAPGPPQEQRAELAALRQPQQTRVAGHG